MPHVWDQVVLLLSGSPQQTFLWNELWSSSGTIVWVMEPLYFLHQGASMPTGWKGLKCRWVNSSEQDFLKLVQCSFPEMAIHVWISSPCIFALCCSHETFVVILRRLLECVLRRKHGWKFDLCWPNFRVLLVLKLNWTQHNRQASTPDQSGRD